MCFSRKEHNLKVNFFNNEIYCLLECCKLNLTNPSGLKLRIFWFLQLHTKNFSSHILTIDKEKSNENFPSIKTRKHFNKNAIIFFRWKRRHLSWNDWKNEVFYSKNAIAPYTFVPFIFRHRGWRKWNFQQPWKNTTTTKKKHKHGIFQDLKFKMMMKTFCVDSIIFLKLFFPCPLISSHTHLVFCISKIFNFQFKFLIFKIRFLAENRVLYSS